MCPAEKMTLLSDVVSTKTVKQQIEGWNKTGNWHDGRAVIDAIGLSEDSPTFRVLQYGGLTEKQLGTKLAQFQAGTELRWQFWKPGEIFPPVTIAVQEAVFERMRDLAEKHGVTLGKLNYPE
jgi:hypothetical protein